MRKYEEDTNAVSSMKDFFGSWESIYWACCSSLLLQDYTLIHFTRTHFIKLLKRKLMKLISNLGLTSMLTYQEFLGKVCIWKFGWCLIIMYLGFNCNFHKFCFLFYFNIYTLWLAIVLSSLCWFTFTLLMPLSIITSCTCFLPSPSSFLWDLELLLFSHLHFSLYPSLDRILASAYHKTMCNRPHFVHMLVWAIYLTLRNAFEIV